MTGTDTGPQATIRRFYTAFADLDSTTMGQCYAPGATFRDPVFTLDGAQDIAGMWSMLCDGARREGRDVWDLQFRDVVVTGLSGAAHWDARYRFTATGRTVVNHVDASLRFDEAGRIVDHTDRFDFWAWSRQALGTTGLVAGWTPMLRSQVRSRARANLARYLGSR